MSVCNRAQEILNSDKIVLSQKAMNQLSRYDEIDQVHIVTNPKGFGIIQRCINQILNELQGNTPHSSAPNIKNNKTSDDKPKPKIETKKEEPKADSGSDSDGPGMFDLFG